MKLLEKVKNMFTEEVEDDDVKVEEIKKEVTHVTVEAPLKSSIESDLINDAFNEEEKVNKPVFFNEDDFKDLNLTPKVEKKKEEEEEKDLYNAKLMKQMEEEERKVFKPTPIISPVYGVLDKNYHKEDIVSRNDVKSSNEKVEPSIDSIRNKAYGTLEDELENTLFGNNSILFKRDEEPKVEETKDKEDDLLSDLTDDLTRELDELLVKKTKNETNKLDENDDLNEDDLLGFIDSTLYKKGDE